MELQFIKERLTIIRRLKGLTIKELELKMKELSGRSTGYALDRWEKIEAKHKLEVIQLLADALQIPLEFFYFPQIRINITSENQVYIHIDGTNKSFAFNFFTGETIIL